MDERQSKRARVSEASSSSASVIGNNYYVFLSFRGSDTRNGFVDHLYHRLRDVGLSFHPNFVFRDDNDLPFGEDVGKNLIDAIKHSKVSIPIISEKYAASEWCLRELIQIMECVERGEQRVLPVLYKVKPYEVREVQGAFGEAFKSHMDGFKEDVKKQGPKALRKVADTRMFDSEKFADGNEGVLIDELIEIITREQQPDFPLSLPGDLAGIDDRVAEVTKLLDTTSPEVQTIAIYDRTDHSSSMSRQPPYEVFLSFSGPEMRRGFTDFLYTMLTDTGIRVVRDEEEVEKGKENFQQQTQVIEQCKMSIPIISEEYASSKKCLTELEQMVEGMDNKGRIIIPIFYYIDPSDVRHCNGPFQRAIDEHKELGVSDSVIDSWKSALRRIGELKGHHLHEKSEVSHGKVVKRIVHQVQQKLKREYLIVPKHLVGVDSHVQGIMAKLKVDYRNGQAVRIGDAREKVLGIYGIPGVGKTVLAKCVYNQLYHLFDTCSFLGEIQAEIKHGNVLSVQNKLISDLSHGNAQKFNSSGEALIFIRSSFKRMKILLLLDDVKDHEQLNELVGKLDWLGPGSRVIVTSQRKDVLENIDGAETFILGLMKKDEALTLFCRHAFGADSPREKFEDLSKKIVAATGGLPLALQVVGSSLYLVDSKKAWRETLTALEVAPDEKVQAALAKSYSNLNDEERQIFLDIACFFIGEDVRIPYYMWADCNYSPSKSILALKAASLVEIGEDNELHMHEILKNFGQEMVKNESRNKPFKRSRLFDHEEALHVLKRRKGTGKVEALRLEFGEGSGEHTSLYCDEFDGLENLRFLKLDRADIHGDFGNRLSSLRWLHWQGCPKVFDVQSLNLNLQNLVILDLSWSQVDKDWGGWELLKQARKLKVLKLTGCVQLIATPEFPASMELEILILEGCSKLAVIHPSFGNLKKLVSLNLKGCSRLRELPDVGPMTALEELVIDGTSIALIHFAALKKLNMLSLKNCRSLSYLSSRIGKLRSLQSLDLSDTTIVSLPYSIESLEKLNTLSLKNCQSLSYLPDGIGKLESLQFLDLSDTEIVILPESIVSLEKLNTLSLKNCWKLSYLPDEIGKLRSLQFLDLSGTGIFSLRNSIVSLEKLNTLSLKNCRCLSLLPSEIGKLESLQSLDLSDTGIGILPESIVSLEKLNTLSLKNCRRLSYLPDGIGKLRSLQFLDLSDTEIVIIPESIVSLEKLNSLSLKNCRRLSNLPDGIGKLRSLQSLDLSGTKIVTLPDSIGSLEKLNTLSLKNCRRLSYLPYGIRKLRSLQSLDLSSTEFATLPESETTIELQTSDKDLKAMKVLR